jgi:hypothetical protein
MMHEQDLTPYAIGQQDELLGDCCAQCGVPFDRHQRAYLCERTDLVYCSPECAAEHGDGLPDGMHLATRLCHCQGTCECGQPTVHNAGFILAFDESYDAAAERTDVLSTAVYGRGGFVNRWRWVATIDVHVTDDGSHALREWWRTPEGRAESDQCRPVVVAMASFTHLRGGDV